MEARVRSGGCLCGAIRYSVRGEPLQVRRCHCTSCRKESGSAFSVYAVWPVEAFEMSGEISSFDGRGFCPRCGSRLIDTADADDTRIEIRIGSLDEAPVELKPDDEVWVRRRESWIPPVEGAAQHDESAARRPSYDPTIYRGAAVHYRRGRPAYSPQLEAVLTEELDLDGSGRLLDGGCGPGILTVRLAHLFEEAVGLDPDPAMLAEGRRVAEGRGITNIRWVEAVAEDLPAAAPGPYRLVTFGSSFHWTDEFRVAEAVYDMLQPGGALAMIVNTVEGRSTPPGPGPPPIPHDEIKQLVERYLGSTRRAGRGTAPNRTHRFEDVLVRTRFGAPRSIFAPGIPDLVRDSESVLSGYFSFSYSAPHLFGDRVEDFAREVRDLLASRSPEGVFWDWPGDTEVVLARKPG